MKKIKSLYTILLVLVRYDIAYVTLLLVLTFCQGLFPALSIWFLKGVVDEISMFMLMGQPAISQRLAWLVGAFFSIYLLNALVSPFKNYLVENFSSRITLHFKETILEKLDQFKGIKYFENPLTYQKIMLADQGSQQIYEQMFNSCVALIQNLITIISFIGILFYLNIYLSVVIIIFIVINIFIQNKLSKQKITQITETSYLQRVLGYHSGLFTNTATITEIKILSAGSFFLKKFRRTSEEFRQLYRKGLWIELRLGIITGCISTLSYAILFAAIIYEAFSNRVTIGNLFFYITAIDNLKTALLLVINLLAGLNVIDFYHQQYKDLMELDGSSKTMSKVYMPPLHEKISFKNVSFRYSEDQNWILHDLSLDIPKNSCLALVGANGSGKSTFTKLLNRLYEPQNGAILWDNINIIEYDITNFRARMSTVAQNFAKYEISLQENVTLKEDLDAEELDRFELLMENLSLDEKIAHLTNGNQTMMSRNLYDGIVGEDLSGGEWQKIAIGRALYRQPDVLILDEPTSALDAESEYEIYQSLLHAVKHTTVILISHRMSTIKLADQIAVIEDGRIAEYGSHDELITRNGIYARMYRTQESMYAR